MDKNKLYRIEVLMHQNLPEIDTAGMFMTNEGFAYVKLHPVKIKSCTRVQRYNCEHGITDENKPEIVYCQRLEQGVSIIMHRNDFCSLGERKENEQV